MHSGRVPLLLLCPTICCWAFLLLLWNGASAMQPKNRPMPPHFPDRVPDDVAAKLPPEVVVRLNAIHANASLTIHEKMNQINEIMTEGLTEEDQDRIPEPKEWDELPKEVKKHVKGIFRQKGIPFMLKDAQFVVYANTLPDDQMAKLLAPHFPDRVPDDVAAKLPKEVVVRLNAVHANASLTTREKMIQIDEIMTGGSKEEDQNRIPEPEQWAGLPEDVKQHAKGIFLQKDKTTREKIAELVVYAHTLPVDQTEKLLAHLQQPPPPQVQPSQS